MPLSDDDHAALRVALERLIDHFKPLLGLETWAVDLVATKLEDAAMEIFPEPKYREADLMYDPYALSHKDEAHLEEVVLHELAHCRVAEFISTWKLSEATVTEDDDETARQALREHLEEMLVTDISVGYRRCWRAGLTGSAD